MEKQRMILSLLLVAMGLSLLAYGLHSQAAVAPSGEEGQTAAMSELAVTQEVARGGVKRDESGEIKKTYGEGEKAPAACPT